MMFLSIFSDNWTARLLTFLIATIAISTMSLLFLEKPIRNRRDWFVKIISSNNYKMKEKD